MRGMHKMSSIPSDLNQLLTREQTATALTKSGFPTSKATLATKASRDGSGPPYRRYGARVLYRWGDALEWAKGRLSPPRSNTSEHNADRKSEAA